MKTKEFIQKAVTNKDLRNQMQEAKNVDQAYNIAVAQGVTDSKDIFVSEAKKVMSAINNITESDFSTVLSSASTSEIVSAVSTYTAAAATAASAAAV